MRQSLIIILLVGLFHLKAQSQDPDSPWQEEEEQELVEDSPWPTKEDFFSSSTPFSPPPPPVPIDGGVGLLLAAGVGYGLREMRKRRKNGN